MSKVAVLQSNYIPWKGYFDIINDVDLFIFYDEVQYTKNDWRNRNRLYMEDGKTPWLTVSCGKGIHRMIEEVKINNDTNWAKKHWDTISQAYSRAPHFSKYKAFFENVYLEQKWENLSKLNQYIITHISNDFLHMETEFASSRDYASTGQKSEKLLSLLLLANCSEYISGPAAKSYLDESAFNEKGIQVVWKDYSGYPEYQQRATPFEPNVSIIDILMNVGEVAPYYIWGWREK